MQLICFVKKFLLSFNFLSHNCFSLWNFSEFFLLHFLINEIQFGAQLKVVIRTSFRCLYHKPLYKTYYQSKSISTRLPATLSLTKIDFLLMIRATHSKHIGKRLSMFPFQLAKYIKNTSLNINLPLF